MDTVVGNNLTQKMYDDFETWKKDKTNIPFRGTLLEKIRTGFAVLKIAPSIIATVTTTLPLDEPESAANWLLMYWDLTLNDGRAFNYTTEATFLDGLLINISRGIESFRKTRRTRVRSEAKTLSAQFENLMKSVTAQTDGFFANGLAKEEIVERAMEFLNHCTSLVPRATKAAEEKELAVQ